MCVVYAGMDPVLSPLTSSKVCSRPKLARMRFRLILTGACSRLCITVGCDGLNAELATGSSSTWGRRPGLTFLDVRIFYAVDVASGADGFHR